MTINIRFGRPAPKDTPSDEVDVVDKVQSIFTKRNLMLLTVGVGLGIILKQRSDIATLKRTVDILTEVVR